MPAASSAVPSKALWSSYSLRLTIGSRRPQTKEREALFRENWAATAAAARKLTAVMRRRSRNQRKPDCACGARLIERARFKFVCRYRQRQEESMAAMRSRWSSAGSGGALKVRPPAHCLVAHGIFHNVKPVFFYCAVLVLR
jgi:hypothetical protein